MDNRDEILEELRFREFAKGRFTSERKAKDWTQEQMAEHLGISQQMVSAIERGTGYFFSKAKVEALIERLNKELMEDTMNAIK